MLAGVSAVVKHRLRLVIRIRLEIHESCYPLQSKPTLKEMAAAPIEEGKQDKITVPALQCTPMFYVIRYFRQRIRRQ